MGGGGWEGRAGRWGRVRPGLHLSPAQPRACFCSSRRVKNTCLLSSNERANKEMPINCEVLHK